MPIHVVCPGCKTSFKVGDQHAGKKGPCPKCKTVITVPTKKEEVVIHAPQAFGPKDAKGRAVLKPIFRQDAKFSMTTALGTAGGVLLVVVIGLVLRLSVEDKENFPLVVLGAGAILLAPPVVYGGYAALRADESAPHSGAGLWVRVTLCSLVYALIWGVIAGVNWYVFENEGFAAPMLLIVVPLMVLAGGGTAFASLDLEFFSGLFHYGFYLMVTVLLRLLVGIPAFPLAGGSG